MKYVLSFLLILVLAILGYGFYIKSVEESQGEIIIGIGVLIIAFILMPLFIFHRYKNKNVKDFTFEKYRKDLDEHIKKENNG
mgnify:CR=1 FL=1